VGVGGSNPLAQTNYHIEEQWLVTFPLVTLAARVVS